MQKQKFKYSMTLSNFIFKLFLELTLNKDNIYSQKTKTSLQNK